MKVSILIPYYNDREYLPKAIESILNQSFKDFELILVNHATTDDCREIAHSYTDPRIIHIDMEKNYGAGTGLVLEKVLKIAKGEYMKLFCADDILCPDGLKMLVEYMDSHPEKDFAFGNADCIDKNGKSMNKTFFSTRMDFSINNDEAKCLQLFFKTKSFLPYITSIVRTKCLKNIKIDKSFIGYFDVYLWTALLIKNYKIGYTTKIVAKYRIHSGQSSSMANKKKIIQYSEYEKQKFIECFLEIQNDELFRKVFKDNPFVKKHSELNSDDKYFITCYEMLFNPSDAVRHMGYYHLYDLMDNPESRKYFENKFNFGIKELRAIYTTIDINRHYVHNAKYMLFVLFKMFLGTITFSKLRNAKKKQLSM